MRSCEPIILQRHFKHRHRNSDELSTDLLAFADDVIQLFECHRLVTVSGSFTVDGLAIGSEVDVYVDHSASGIFKLAEPPRFSEINDVDILVYAMVDIAGAAKLTNGSGFAVRITNVNKSDYSPSFTVSWTRTGIRQP